MSTKIVNTRNANYYCDDSKNGSSKFHSAEVKLGGPAYEFSSGFELLFSAFVSC